MPSLKKSPRYTASSSSDTPVRLLGVAAFRYQFLAQLLLAVGTSLSPVALSLGVLLATGSTGALSAVLTASTVPTLVFLLIGGVWADRLPRHQLMVACNLVSALTQGSIGVMMVTGNLVVWVAVCLQAATGISIAFYFPAAAGLTAVTTPKHCLQQANALMSFSRNIARSVGPLAAGAAVAFPGGAGWTLVVTGLTFLGSAHYLSRISRVVSSPPRTGRQDFRGQLRDGFRAVVGRSWVWSSIGVYSVSHLAIGFFMVLGPILIVERSIPSVVWGVIIAGLSVGSLLGNIVAMRYTPRRPLVAARLAELGMAPMVLLLATDVPVWVLPVVAVVAGMGMSFPDALWYTALQQRLPEDLISRVSAYDSLGSVALRSVAYGLAAVLAGLWGAAPLLIAGAVAIVASRLCGLLPRDVRELPPPVHG